MSKGLGSETGSRPKGKTNQALIATAYWAYDVTLMRADGARDRTARAMSRNMRQLFEKIRAAFDKAVCARGWVCRGRG